MQRRGGARRRCIRPGIEARAHYSGGRWGPRRVRTTECYAIVTAEDWYTALLADDAARLGPGSHGSGTVTFEGRQHTARWEVRSNAVWRRGRVFLVCPRCSHRRTRLYLPRADSWLACRTCWGLTYASRTLLNYKESPWGRGKFAGLFGTSQWDWALMTTNEKRRTRLEASQKRWRDRRVLFLGNSPSQEA
jgi:hypothetical protein